MVSKGPLALAILTWTMLNATLQLLVRAQLLSPVMSWYLYYFLGAAVTGLLYWALGRITASQPGSRLFTAAAVLEGVSAVLGLVAMMVPGALEALAFPGPIGVNTVFDALSIAGLGLSAGALLTTRVAPPWVSAFRFLSLAYFVAQDALLIYSPSGASAIPGWTFYLGMSLSVAFWVSLSASLLKQSPAEKPAAGRGASTTPHMVAIVVVMLLLVANFPPLVLGTATIFHGFNLDLLVSLSVAAVAYAALWRVGASLDAKYRTVVADSFADATGRPAVPQELTDAYGLMLVCLLPFLFYLFVFSLYAVELLITEALRLMDAMQLMPIVVIVGLLFVAGGSIWGVALGVWRLLVAPKTRDAKIEISRAENSALWAVVDGVARDSGTRTVDRIWITSTAQVAVWEQGGLGKVLSGRAPRCMSIGLSAVHDLSVSELGAILRHEFAHFSNRDTAWGSFTYSMDRSLLAAWQATPGGNPFKARSFMGGVIGLNPAWWVYWLFVRLFYRATAGFSRLRELIADWDAIAYAGGPCFASGLTKVIVNGGLLDAWLRDTPVVEGEVPSVAVGVARAAAEMDSEQLAESRDTALTRDPGTYDTHPDPRTRIEYAMRAAETAEACSEEPVSGLFEDWDALDAMASRAWLAPGTVPSYSA